MSVPGSIGIGPAPDPGFWQSGCDPDHENLRAAGFEDQAILQITLIASWFNYINRVADALGVGRD